jgi:hypothetical protein
MLTAITPMEFLEKPLILKILKTNTENRYVSAIMDIFSFSKRRRKESSTSFC